MEYAAQERLKKHFISVLLGSDDHILYLEKINEPENKLFQAVRNMLNGKRL